MLTALLSACFQDQETLQFHFRCITFCPHMHTLFSPFGYKAKLEYLTWLELQKGHLWQGEAQEQLPESGRKPPPPSIKSSPEHCQEPPLPCLDSHTRTSVSTSVLSRVGTANSPAGYSGHPMIQTDPIPDEKPALLMQGRSTPKARYGSAALAASC